MKKSQATQQAESSEPPKLWLGLPASEADNYNGPWEKPEIYSVWVSLFWVGLIVIGTIISMTTSNEVLAMIFAPPDEKFWDMMYRQVPTVFFLCVALGWLVEYKGVNVAYTRKFGHIIGNFIFPLLVIPTVISGVELYREWYISITWRSLFVYIVPYIILVRPFRSRFRILYLCFRTYDRPEDRPYTMLWYISQLLMISVILIPMAQYFAAQGMWSLFLIAACSNGLGDGLAEPLGKIYGKKKYKVRALFTNREYTRSYVGSACVAFFTAVGILFNIHILSTSELIILLAVLPLLMAVVEAKSPHTWDNAFMYGGCWIVIYLVVFI